MDNDDEPIAKAVLDVALPAQQLLTVAEALAEQYGAEAVRTALLIAFAVFGERALGEQGMRDELSAKVARMLENPTIEAAVHKWLH